MRSVYTVRWLYSVHTHLLHYVVAFISISINILMILWILPEFEFEMRNQLYSYAISFWFVRIAHSWTNDCCVLLFSIFQFFRCCCCCVFFSFYRSCYKIRVANDEWARNYSASVKPPQFFVSFKSQIFVCDV